jgi:L-threonylcarbamoyladenylate synthase
MHLEDQIRTAIAILKNGGTVVYPTETVYGLGADALSEEAIRKVYN